MGWENVFQVEKDPFCQAVLKKNFPNTKRYGDIKEFDGTKYRGTIDVVSGGFPCQPYSNAGKRKGKDDERHLWPEMLRVIREIQPSYVVGENVGGLLTWNNGLVFDEVQIDLENSGYQVQPIMVPACAKNAPHRRDRIWIIAHFDNTGAHSSEFYATKTEQSSFNGIDGCYQNIDSNNRSERIQRNEPQEVQELERIQRSEDGGISAHWKGRSEISTPILCRTYDGIPFGMDRIKSLGNAIVTQVAYEIFKAIEGVKLL